MSFRGAESAFRLQVTCADELPKWKTEKGSSTTHVHQ